MAAQLFDLNIQDFLESWTLRDAVRELLANALDESLLSDSPSPTATRIGSNEWEIRDWGRGLRPEHLAQAEDEEKQRSTLPVIGRFGVGLKDALATLHRHEVHVEIVSRHAHYTLAVHGKHDFGDLETLHVAVDRSAAWAEAGTRVRLRRLPDLAMHEARDMFLQFSPCHRLARGRYGEVLEHAGDGPAPIYIRGLRVATEEAFRFGYNITSLTKAMKDALNRERSHVGRTAYAGRVKQLLLSTREPAVADALAEDLEGLASGRACDEVKSWSDVAVHACKVLNAQRPTLFVDATQLGTELDAIDLARSDGLRVVTIPTDLLDRLRGTEDYDGNPIRTLEEVAREWKDSFNFRFVEEHELSDAERRLWSYRDAILRAAGGRPAAVREIRISETMRPELGNPTEVVGLWQPSDGRVVVKRCQLRALEALAGTLAHEAAHARSGRPDVDRAFEGELTQMLGWVIAEAVRAADK